MKLVQVTIVVVSCLVSMSVQFPPWAGAVYGIEPYNGLYGGHLINRPEYGHAYGLYQGDILKPGYNPNNEVFPFGSFVDGGVSGNSDIQEPDSYFKGGNGFGRSFNGGSNGGSKGGNNGGFNRGSNFGSKGGSNGGFNNRGK